MKNMDTEFIKAFESRICDLLPSQRKLIHEAIHKCVEDTNAWLNRLPAPTSLLNIRTYFVERFSETVPTGEALQDGQVLSALLDDVGLRNVGDFVDIRGEQWEVIWRRFGWDFGIEFGLRNASVEIVSHVFFD